MCVCLSPLSAPGEVFDYLVAHGRMKEKEARAKFRQVSHRRRSSRSSVVTLPMAAEARWSRYPGLRGTGGRSTS